MSKTPLYVKKMAGFFPEANSVEVFWENLKAGKVSKTAHLSDYWKLPAQEYGDKSKDTFISVDLGHLADYPFTPKKYPRQIQAAIDLGQDLLKDSEVPLSECALIVATEWTDPSYYEEALGKNPPGSGFSVDRQIETIKRELGLTGPALAVDTACASSLYAIELARGYLQSGTAKAVVVIGLNLYLHSFLYRGFTKLGALSQKGALRSFDAEADGIIPGEAACGVLIDSRFEGAISQIDSLGLSADGNEGSAFSPGFEGQIEAYKRTYETSELSPSDIDYLEAHGTATVLGDQTETSSIEAFFKRTYESPIRIGSVKSITGHTLAASGLVSLIKASLIIQNKLIPPHIKIEERRDLKEKGILISDTEFSIRKKKVAVAISSFGFGGSNAHVILKTPEEMTSEKPPRKDFYIRSLDFKASPLLNQSAPVLQHVPMGPRMQERYDHLQRHALHSVQKLVTILPHAEKKKLSVVFLNNLGGSLSLAFEKKYHQKLSVPELSIEAIASTLPSMLSGNPCMLFDLRGHHMLLSGAAGSLGDTLTLIPYLLEEAEGDIILGVANEKAGLLILHVSLEDKESLAHIAVEKDTKPSNLEAMVEATGMKELNHFLNTEGDHNLQIGPYSFSIKTLKKDNSRLELKESLLTRSQENKDVALQYLQILKSLRPEEKREQKVGEFLRNAVSTKGKASAELIVDESHPYFFDHPLDHVPGILSIHGCEELLFWYLNGESFVQDINIRFTKFLEKNESIQIEMEDKGQGQFEFTIFQEKKKAGSLKVKASKKVPVCLTGIEKPSFESEEKKYTHKHREENILVSKLKAEDSVTALPLQDKCPFFKNLTLKRPSTLYYAEVTRQFVMLMAHLKKGIPLNMKMNLINTEIRIAEWIRPSFDLHLKDFDLIETEDFLLADVLVEFRHEGRVFGEGKIKAQVVSGEYYGQQRGEG